MYDPSIVSIVYTIVSPVIPLHRWYDVGSEYRLVPIVKQIHNLLVGVATDQFVLHLQHPGPGLQPSHLGQPVYPHHGTVLVNSETKET